MSGYQPPGFNTGRLTGTLWLLRSFELRFCVGRLAGIAFGRAPGGCAVAGVAG
jgi:hypothetical protein